MKSLLILTTILVLVFSFGLSAAGQNSWHQCVAPPDCYIDLGCADGVCWHLKCCREMYFYKGECVWSEYECYSMI